MSDFVLSFWRACQWPTRAFAIFAVVAWLPWCWLVVRAWRAGRAADLRERVVAATGAWVLLQYLAAAYARGAGAEWPADRYFDTEAVGLLANVAALVVFFAAPRAPAVRAGWFAFAALWVGLLAHGLSQHLPQAFGDIKTIGAELKRDEIVTRAYLASNDRAILEREPVLPYPGVDGFAARIDPPAIRAIMPVSVRLPLPMSGATRGGNFILTDFTLRKQPPLDTLKAPNTRDGLSPATPRLEYATTWGSFGAKSASEWESEPMTPSGGGWLKFEMAGDTDAPGVSLQLLDARTRRPLANVRPTKPPHNTWRAAYVRMPARPFVVAAGVTDPAHWLAFNQPAVMPIISHTAWQMVRNGAVVLWISSGAAVLLGIAAFVARRRVA